MQDPKIEDLRAFCEIVRVGSLSGAARELSTSVSSVSRRLQRLESTVGRPLITRSTRRAQVTDAGHALFREASAVLDRIEAMMASGPGSRVAGKVVVLAPTLISEYAFGGLRAVLDAHPSLAIEWVAADRPTSNELLRADLVVHLGPPPVDSPLIARRMGEIRGQLAAAPSYVAQHGAPRRLRELSDHRLLRFRGGRAQDTLTLVNRAGEPRQVAVRGSFESSSSSVLRAALYEGAGIGFVSERELRRASERGELSTVLSSYRTPAFELHLLYAPSGRRMPRLQVVIEWLERALD